MGDRATAEVERRSALAWPHKDDLRASAAKRLDPDGAHDAEDAAIETVTRYLASETAGRVPDKEVRPYLFGVLRNVCHEMNRQVVPLDTVARVAAQESVPAPDVSEVVAERARYAPALTRWRRLPKAQRDALAYDAAGLTVAEAARRAGVGHRTAESRLTAARRTLRRVAAPVAALLSLWRTRPRRAGAVALALAAAALVPAVVRLAPKPSRPAMVTDAGPAPVLRREAQDGRSARANGQRMRAATPTATATPAPESRPASRSIAPLPHGWDVRRPLVFASPTADRPLLDVVRECVENGVEVTPERVGCRT